MGLRPASRLSSRLPSQAGTNARPEGTRQAESPPYTVFLRLEDETGIANVIVPPDVFEAYRLPLVEEPFLLIDGAFQRQDGEVQTTPVPQNQVPCDQAS